jgi:hypothetical protein
MENSNVEISIHGKWVTVPAVEASGHTLAITGKWLKVAKIRDEDYMETELQDPELCIKGLKEQRSRRLRADIFTFTQKLPATLPRFSYPMEWESVAAVCTTSFKEWWEKLPQESRKNVRRAQKRGVVALVKPLDDDLVRDIVDLNCDSPIRQGRPFVHYGKAFDQVKKDQASFPGRSDYVCAYFENRLIGFLKVAYCREIASIVQILPRASHHDKRPANALLAKAIELCEAKGMLYMTYGLFNYGNKSDSTLRQFKIRNGFEEMLVPRYYAPVTAWGRVCTRLKLYRGLLGILPSRVTRAGVSARAKWYQLAGVVRAGVAQW